MANGYSKSNQGVNSALRVERGEEAGQQVGGAVEVDRGREGRLGSASPPSEPDVRISRIRLSG